MRTCKEDHYHTNAALKYLLANRPVSTRSLKEYVIVIIKNNALHEIKTYSRILLPEVVIYIT